MRLLTPTLFLLVPTLALAQSPEPPPQDAPASVEAPAAEEAPPVEDPEGREGLAPQVETAPPPAPAASEEVQQALTRAPEAPEAAQAPWSPFVDTRLTFVFADDNVLAGPGESLEPSPGPQFRATGENNLFFENYDTKDSGFETATHLVLYKEVPTFFDGLTAEMALVLRLDVNATDTKGTTRITDSSSYISLHWQPRGWGEGERISLTGFPVRSDRFRLGYSYRLTYGGDDIFPRSKYSVPGARLQVTRDRWYAWVGAKSAVIDEQVAELSEQNTEEVANYGALAGAGVDVTGNLRLEANGGFFTRGAITGQPALQGVKSYAGGGSFQAAWHVGRPVGTSIDLRLYRNDPFETDRFFRPETYGGPLSYVVKGEVTYLTQTLADPTAAGSTVRQPAMAADVNAAFKFGYNRLFLDAAWQDLTFLLFNVPSLTPWTALPEEAKANPEMFVAVGYDHYLEALHLTPGLRFGVQRPASVVTDRLPLGLNPPATLTGSRTVVIRDRFTRNILPPDEGVSPVFAVQGTARLDLAETLAVLGEVFYEYDPNRATFAQTVYGETVAVFDTPDVLGLNLVVQGRF